MAVTVDADLLARCSRCRGLLERCECWCDQCGEPSAVLVGGHALCAEHDPREECEHSWVEQAGPVTYSGGTELYRVREECGLSAHAGAGSGVL